MIRVRIRWRWHEQMCRMPPADAVSETPQSRFAPLEQEVGHALVGERKKLHAFPADAESCQSRERFSLPAGAPAAPVAIANAHFAFEHSLRPAIALAIGRVNDPHGRAGSDYALQKNARGERFIVGVRREEHYARACREMRQIHFWNPGLSRTNC